MTADAVDGNATVLAIGVLLEDTILLSRVLQHLNGSNIAVCRLVCRQWRHTCSQLPLKLNLYPTLASLHTMRRFPHVTSVNMVENSSYMWRSPRCTVEDVCSHLQSMRRLEHLVPKRMFDIRYLQCLQSLSTIRALDLSQCPYFDGILKEVLLDSGHWSRLTSLILLVSVNNSVQVQRDQPPCQDQTLRRLFRKTSSVKMDQVKELRLVFTDSLTHIFVVTVPLYFRQSFPSITGLKINKLHGNFSVSFPDLHLCTTLERLYVDIQYIKDATLLWRLSQILKLRDIHLDHISTLWNQSVPFESLSVLRQLESLTLRSNWYFDHTEKHPPVCMKNFTRLTKLDIGGISCFDSLSNLQTLKELRLSSRELGASTLDQIPMLTNLEVLYLDARRKKLGMSLIVPLRKLREVYLSIGLEDGTLDVLAALTGLTSLHLKVTTREWREVSLDELKELHSLKCA